MKEPQAQLQLHSHQGKVVDKQYAQAATATSALDQTYKHTGCHFPCAFQITRKLFPWPALLQNQTWNRILRKVVPILLNWHTTKPL